MDLKQASFGKALEKIAYSNTKWNDTVTSYDKTTTNDYLFNEFQKPLEFIKCPNNLCHLQEFNNILIYFFTKEYPDNDKKPPNKGKFDLAVFSFTKKEGKYDRKDFTELYGKPSCITSGMMARLKDHDMMAEGKKTPDDFNFRIVILVGLKDGFLKIIQLATDKEEKSVKPTVVTHKLEQKPIVQIAIPDKTHYNYKNISFVMFEDCKVFVFNYLSRQVICVYQPPILNHDQAICLTIHDSGKYFATASRTGQITFWELSEKAFESIEKSQKKDLKGKKKVNNEDEQIMMETWTFSIKDRVLSVFPLSAIHSACITGLKWISFYGNLLAIITSKGCFRLLALNLQLRDEFIILIEFVIPNGDAITSAQLLPNRETLVVFKSSYVIEDKILDVEPPRREPNKAPPTRLTIPEMTFKEEMMTSDSKYFRFNYNGLEKRYTKDNSVDYIKFGNTLKIEAYDKYFVENTKKSFDWGVVASDGDIVLLRNEQGFFIGLLK